MQNQQQFESPQETSPYLLQAQTEIVPAQAQASEAPLTVGAENLYKAEAVENLLREAKTESETYHRTRRMYRIARPIMFALLFVMFLVWLINGILKGKWMLDFFPMLGVLAGFGATSLTQSHKNAVSKLAQIDDIRAVGLLTDMLESKDGLAGPVDSKLIADSRAALIRLLPRLQFSDAALLSAEQRDILSRALPKVVTREDRALSLAVLQAFRQVGGEREAEAVAKLAESSVAAYDSELREAARDCLPFLRESLARRREGATLLRASHAEDARPETLLRPAAYVAGQNDAQELLRPTQTEL